MEIEVIRYEPTGADAHEIIAHKHEIEDFSNRAQLNVAPSQVAIFVNEGEMHALGPNHYTLDESNNSAFGFLQKWRTRFSKGVSAYHCSVYFINTSPVQEMPFGSTEPIPMEDPVEGVNIHVRFAGYFAAHVDNDDKDGSGVIRFFEQVVKTAGQYTKTQLTNLIRSEIMTQAKDLLANVMKEQDAGILQVSSKLVAISNAMRERMAPEFKKLGIVLDRFSFTTINCPNDELAAINESKQALRKAKLAAQQLDVESEAMARKRAREGYTYQQEQTLAAMNTAAGNEASTGQFMGMGMGLGMGLGMGPAMGNAMGNMMNEATNPNAAPQQMPQQQPAGNNCPKCGAPIPPGSRFCPGCGAQVAPAGNVCPKCGAQVPAGSRFCPSCGNPMTAGKVCPKCGKALEPGARFCPDCGQKIE